MWEFRPPVARSLVPLVSLLVVTGGWIGIAVAVRPSRLVLVIGGVWLLAFLGWRLWPATVEAVTALRGPHPALVPEGVRLRESTWRIGIETATWAEIAGMWVQRFGRRRYLGVQLRDPYRAGQLPVFIRLGEQTEQRLAEAVATHSGGAAHLGDRPYEVRYDAFGDGPMPDPTHRARRKRFRPLPVYAYVVPALAVVGLLLVETVGPASWSRVPEARPDPSAIGGSAFGGNAYPQRAASKVSGGRSCTLTGDRTSLEITVQDFGTKARASEEVTGATLGTDAEKVGQIGDSAFFGGSFASGRDQTLVYQSVASLLARKGSRTVVVTYRGQAERNSILTEAGKLARTALA
jgi:hypothetical protein